MLYGWAGGWPIALGWADPVTGFTGVSPDHWDDFEPVACPMEIGDVLCFHHLTPHRALPNLSHSVRWSLDVRFERSDVATESGSQMGFPLPPPPSAENEAEGEDAAAAAAPLVSCEEWLRRWEGMPRGSY